MRRITVILGAFLLVFSGGAAFAQTLGDLGDAIDVLDGETVEEWGEAATGVRDALGGFVEAEPELEAELEAEIEAFEGDLDALDAAIEGGDLDEIAAAAEAAKVSGAALVAAADAADVEEPTAVDTGSAVNSGPSIALLAVATVLAMLAGGALALRETADRS